MSVKNLPKLKVSLKFKRLADLALISFAKTSSFHGDPDAANPPYSDNDIYFYADDFMASLINMKTESFHCCHCIKEFKTHYTYQCSGR